MKRIVVLLVFIMTVTNFGQSSQDDQDKKWRQEMTNRNGFPPTHASPSIFDTRRVDEVTKSFPIIFLPRDKPQLSKDEIEEIKKEEERVELMRAPRAEDLAKFSEFLKQKNTGMFRLFPDLDCNNKLLVDANDNCAQATSLSWSYSFIYKYHGTEDLYDLRLKDGGLVADGFLSQAIMAPLGDIPLDSVSLNSNGMKFLNDFKPEKKSQKAKAQFTEIAKTITVDGYVYGKVVNFSENQTYALRLIDYQLADRHKLDWTEQDKIKSKEERKLYLFQYAKRADKTIVFRVIRRDTDGSITILWKELSDKKAPIIVFDKNEKLTDLKMAS
ncbi:MAG: hypothetical protein K1X72_20870 [Pyrinomonadaceae bacterium]|nr:hypothetical protein [Pyrinomonadaceae bacterium]